ncbi:MAG: family 10 glycosylhydrolase [Prevotellaceae bacterium]|jgi:uncharacterized lipoprotein YddW (UPF0748 family)|nr:family 10 glycosylhydrolase [Prevotellaceae bacterium]
MNSCSKNKFGFLLLFFFAFTFFVAAQHHKRQMRAVWVATVHNIDFPSDSTLTTGEQKKELIDLLDNFKECNLNTVIFQARPTSDAFYFSNIESWSQFLTGKAGRAPEPFYDPLQFLIDEAHKRCMEVHVWLNPYRVLNSADTTQICPSHLFFKKPELFVKYGGKYYFNPAHEETREYINRVVKDIVQRYDIQAVHFDDYFYPYTVAGEKFPDAQDFADNPRNFENIGDWRRDNVNTVIKELKATIKSTKPWVEFGISPCGVWRNRDRDKRGSNTKAGQTNYDNLYADLLYWIENDYIDYVIPQLYWAIGNQSVDYAIVAEWWNRHSKNVNLYTGLYASGLGTGKETSPWRKGNELARQLKFNERFENISGVALYSGRPFSKNPQGLRDSLQKNHFKYPALVPINKLTKAGNNDRIRNLRIRHQKEKTELKWDALTGKDGNATMFYVLYYFKGDEIGDTEDPKNILTLTTQNSVNLQELTKSLKGTYTFAVTSVNRWKHESEVKSFTTVEF